MTEKSFPQWKLVSIGPRRQLDLKAGRRNAKGLVAAIRAEGHVVTESAAATLSAIRFADEPRHVRLVRTTPRALGVRAGRSWYADLRAIGAERGLQGVPAEAVAVLRLQYVDQPGTDVLTALLPQDEVLTGRLRLLVLDHRGVSLGRPDRPRLRTVDTSFYFGLDEQVLFALPDPARHEVG